MFRIVVARDLNRGIGYKNKLPWNISEEMKYFTDLTTNVNKQEKQNCVIMGRNTYLSIPEKFRPLKNRINIVLSSTMNKTEGIEVFDDIDKILNYVEKNKKKIERCYVIGGELVYRTFLERDLISEIYETLIHNSFSNVDKYFPKYEDNFKIYKTKTLTYEDKNSKKLFPVSFRQFKIINQSENKYLDLMHKILLNGIEKIDRTGVGTHSLFGESLKYDISDGKLPLLTTKFVPIRFIIEELLWFISGSTDARKLQEKKIPIWNGNTTREFLDNRGLNHLPEGDIGAGYGHQLRHFNASYTTCEDSYEGKGFDQLKYVIDLLRHNPESRRILFSYWNPQQLNDATLPPCHLVYQFYVNPRTKEISSCLYQRSSDYFLANNYNAVSAIILTHMLGQICGYKPKEFTHFMGDTHIYKNHFEQCETQLKRNPYVQPRIKLNKNITEIENFRYEDFKIINYYPQTAIRGKMN